MFPTTQSDEYASSNLSYSNASNVYWQKHERRTCSINPLFAGLRSFPSREYENQRIINAVLKRLCIISYAIKYASKTHYDDWLTH